MNKSFIHNRSRSSSTSDNGTSNDSGSSSDDNENEMKYGPDTEYKMTLKKILSSPQLERSATQQQQMPNSSTAPHASNANVGNGVLMRLPPAARRVSLEENSKPGSGVSMNEIVSASVLELFISTLPASQQETIKNLLIDVLNITRVTPKNVFSDVYKATRINMARMIRDQIHALFRMSKIDKRLIMDFPVSQRLTRYEEDFEEIEEIGRGGFGKVYKVKSKVDGQFYAIKKIFLKKTSERAYQRMLEECRLLALLQHPNIIRYHNAWVDICYKPGNRNSSKKSEGGAKIESVSSSSAASASTSPSTSIPTSSVTIEEIQEERNGSNNRSDGEEEGSATITLKKTSSFSSEELQEDEEEESETSNKASSSSSSSSEEEGGGKKKGFWRKPAAAAANAHSFSSFGSSDSESEENAVVDVKDSKSDGEDSDSSLDSTSANIMGKTLAESDFDEEPNKHLQLAIPPRRCDLIGYQTLFIHMELCPTTLEKYIQHRHRTSQPIDPAFDEKITIGLLSAIDFLHQNSIVHRDIKPSNIFLKQTFDKQPIAMLGDFGLARSIVEELALPESPATPKGSSYKLTSGLGTALYASPEQIGTRTYSFPSDIFSAGVVIYELFSNFGTDSERIRFLTELRNTSELGNDFVEKWPELSKILLPMIAKSPAKRPEACELLSKFKKMHEKTCEQTEIQRLTAENQELRERIDYWEQRYADLEKRFNDLQASMGTF